MTRFFFNFGQMRSKIFSLRVMIPVLDMAVMLLLLGYISIHDWQRATEDIYGDFQTSQKEMAARLQADIERDVRIGMRDRLQQSFSELSAKPEVQVAMLIDENSQVIAATRLAMVGSNLQEVAKQYSVQFWTIPFLEKDRAEMTIRQAVLRKRNAIFLIAPVRLDMPGGGLARNTLGRLLIYTDVTVPLAVQQSYAQRQFWQLLTGFIILALLVGVLLDRTVTRRVSRLLHVAERVGEGKLNTVSAVSGPDEIGRLGIAIDLMVRKMARSSTEIRMLLRAVEQSPNSIIITDSDGNIEYVNPHFIQTSGYSMVDMIGKNMRIYQSGMASDEVYKNLWHTIKSGRVWRGELLNRSKQGTLFWEELSISPIFDEMGNITHFLSQQIDITERKQAEDQVRLFEKVFANANEGILISDANNCIIAINPAFTEITGYLLEDVIGKNPHILASGQMSTDFYSNMWSSINTTGKWQGEVVDRRKSGEIYSEWLSISALRDDNGTLTNYVALISDISKRKAAEERMAYLAQHDVLTGLPNRLLFHDRLQQAISFAERQKTSVALLFMDLDRFKDINDTLGHHFGDLLLQQVTRRIRQCVRSSDTISRQGGDEYVIMLSNLGDLGDIVQVANKLIESISEPFDLDGHTVHITTSIGVSIYPQDGTDIETLIRNADTAMYQAKDTGRNGYRFFTQEMNRSIARRVGLENKLRNAMARKELLLYYQPQIDLRSGKIVAAEALVRWQHPDDGLMSPTEFIHIAEECGMIFQIGEWVLNEACRQNQEWREMGLNEIVVAVNLSPLQLHNHNLIEVITKALSTSRMPANALELEITESAMMKNSEQAIGLLNSISRLGIRISIDDFGTGYSSLSHLKKFPVDMLKIDQSFVRDISIDSDDAAIVKAVVNMSKNLGLRVIAEGVETAEQLQFLKRLHCDLVQGHFFSRPVPADEFRKLLGSGQVLNESTA